MDKRTQIFYNTNAPQLAAKYNAHTSSVVQHFLRAFTPKGKILDIGCGSGTNMHTLYQLNFQTTGIDDSQAMMQQAVQFYPELEGRLFQGSFPEEIPAQINNDSSWDGILCSAVLQHIPDSLLFDFLFVVHRLLKAQGSLLLSIPLVYHGIKDNRDRNGRLFHIRSNDEYALLLERIGFTLVQSWESDDGLEREGIQWLTMFWVKEFHEGIRPIDKIESIIREDSKVTTYKFALLRSLGELSYSSRHLVRWERGRVLVPIEPIVHSWIKYYWPLLRHPEVIYQGQRIDNKQDILFRSSLKQLIDYWEEKEDGYLKFEQALKRSSLDKKEGQFFRQVVNDITKALVNGPVKYMGNKRTGPVFAKEEKFISLDAGLWKEFSLMGRWFEDSILLRWAEFSAASRFQPEGVDRACILNLLLWEPGEQRELTLPRKIYQSILEKSGLTCVWSNKKLKHFDVDHAIPFSLWRNNSLWNLFPADHHVNLNKRDRLPTRKFLLSREGFIRGYWDRVYEAESAIFDKELSNLVGDLTYSVSASKDIFRAFCEQIELVALRNAAERWQL